MPAQPDPVRRHAARTATLIAIPLALAVAAFGLWSSGAFRASPAAEPTPTVTAAPPTSPVTMTATPLPDQAAEVCRTIIAKLPETLLGAPRRPVTGGPEQNAAYGEPPVTLACGVAPVTGLDPTDMVNNLGGVCWFGKIATGSTIWTTVDREVPVAVTVPGTADGSAQSVIPFSAAVGPADPVLANPPTGCTP